MVGRRSLVPPYAGASKPFVSGEWIGDEQAEPARPGPDRMRGHNAHSSAKKGQLRRVLAVVKAPIDAAKSGIIRLEHNPLKKFQLAVARRHVGQPQFPAGQLGEVQQARDARFTRRREIGGNSFARFGRAKARAP